MSLRRIPVVGVSLSPYTPVPNAARLAVVLELGTKHLETTGTKKASGPQHQINDRALGGVRHVLGSINKAKMPEIPVPPVLRRQPNLNSKAYEMQKADEKRDDELSAVMGNLRAGENDGNKLRTKPIRPIDDGLGDDDEEEEDVEAETATEDGDMTD